MEKILFSVAIVSFKQFHVIRECIDSVLQQNYPSIELIVCNDSTDDFDSEAIENYIQEKKRDNIISYVVIQNTERLGTVRNANQALNLAKGEYLKLIAADDALWNEHVLNEYAEVFEKDNANIISGRCLVVDNLGIVTRQYPDPNNWKKINTCTPEELFKENVYTNIIHSPGVAIRKSFWIAMGKFSEEYYLVEDWPLWLKICREGYKFYTVKNPVVRYRYGGVSNSTNQETKKYRAECWKDIIKCIEYEIIPNKNVLTLPSICKIRYALKTLKIFYMRDFEYKDSSIWKKLAYKIRFDLFCLKHLCIVRFFEWRRSLILKSVIKPYLFSFCFLATASVITDVPIKNILMTISVISAIYATIQSLRYVYRKALQIVSFIKRKISF